MSKVFTSTAGDSTAFKIEKMPSGAYGGGERYPWTVNLTAAVWKRKKMIAAVNGSDRRSKVGKSLEWTARQKRCTAEHEM